MEKSALSFMLRRVEILTYNKNVLPVIFLTTYRQMQMNEKIINYLSSEQAFNLLLIVNSSTKYLEKLSSELITHYKFQGVILNKELSQALIIDSRQSSEFTIPTWISNHINKLSGTILLSDIDILFEPCIRIDPLRLFRQLSRNKQIIVLWPGDFSNNDLSYATPEHAHFKRWQNPGVNIIQL